MTDNSDAENSEQAVRLARLVAYATAIFDNPGKAERWLNKPQQRFAGRTAFDMATTEQGARLVEEALVQLDEGYFT
jgi:putative toxin-antitoxin system antitoxin component (TIGR02293 family)